MSSSAGPRRRPVRDQIRTRLDQSPTTRFTVELTLGDVDRMTAALDPDPALRSMEIDEMMLQALADGLYFREQQQKGATVLLRQPDGRVEKVVLR